MDKVVMPGKLVVQMIVTKLLTEEGKKTRNIKPVNLIKEKRNGGIKGRECADGSWKFRYLKYDKTVLSPIESLEALFVTLVVDAHEGRDVIAFNATGEFLHAEILKDKNVHAIARWIIQYMVWCQPTISKVYHLGKGKKSSIFACNPIHLWMHRGITIMVWFVKNTLEETGFKLNSYERCVLNKEMDGKKCTVAWYVDNNNISHMKSVVNETIIEYLKKHFG